MTIGISARMSSAIRPRNCDDRCADFSAEGFRHVFVLNTPEDVEAAVVERVPLWNDKRDEHGPFDIIGDVHGCGDELEELLAKLGYAQHRPGRGMVAPSGTEGWSSSATSSIAARASSEVVRLVMDTCQGGGALCVPGNHDMKFMRSVWGKNVQITHGLADSLAQIEALPSNLIDGFSRVAAEFIDGLISHYVLDDGKLVVAHAGMKEEMQGRGSGKVREFALYGETTGETDEFGLPIRFDWASEYRGQAMVVYGHTPVPEPEWLNRTVNIDTGCVFGGKLTALRYPEKEFVSVPAARTYREPARPFLAPETPGTDALGSASSRRGARRRGRARQADHPDPPAWQRHHPRGKRRGGAGGDEPVRR